MLNRKNVVLTVVMVLSIGLAISQGSVYHDEGQFLNALEKYDVVNFNDVTTPPMIQISGDRYEGSHGIVIEDLVGGGIWVRDGAGRQRTLGNVYPAGGCRGTFRVRFVLNSVPTTVEGFGCWFGDVDTENRSGITLFDSSDNRLEGVYAAAGGDNVWTFAGATASNVSYAEVTFDDVPGGVVMDNYYFSRIIPEPATLGLLVAAGGLALLPRRK